MKKAPPDSREHAARPLGETTHSPKDRTGDVAGGVLAHLAGGAPIAEILPPLIATIEAAVKPARVAIVAIDPQTRRLAPFAAADLPPPLTERIASLLASGAVVQVVGMPEDYPSQPDSAAAFDPAAAGTNAPAAPWKAFAIAGRNGRAPGALILISPDPAITLTNIAIPEPLLHLAAIALDYTNLEQVADDTAHRLFNLTADLPGMVFQRRVDPDGRMSYTYVSEGVHELFDISPADVLRDASTLLNTIDEPYRKLIPRNVSAAPDAPHAANFEASITTPAGRRLWVQSIARAHLQPDGATVWDGIVLDITDRKHAEQALIAAKESADASATQLSEAYRWLDIALANMEQGLILLDAHGCLLAWNRRYAEIFGFPADLLQRGITLREMVSYGILYGNYAENEAKASMDAQLLLASRSPLQGLKLILPNGCVIEVTRHTLSDGGTVATFTDITLREKADAALRTSEESLRERVAELEETRRHLEAQSMQLQKLATSLAAARDEAQAANSTKSAFLANMSHELRTPLNAIIGFSDVMTGQLFGALGDDRYVEYAESIRDSGRHLLTIINDILDLSKIEAGKAELHEEPCDVAEIIHASARLLRDRAEQGDIALSVDTPAHLPVVDADPVKLKQILLNLLSNALKFTPRGGRVSAAVALPADGAVDIIVADTGVGMRPEDISKALQPFGQIDNSLSRNHGGTGLGLPLCKALIELHGGSLEIESAPGAGTRITARLPASRVVEPPAAQSRD